MQMDLIFMQGELSRSNYIFSVCEYAVFPATFVEDSDFSLVGFLHLRQNQLVLSSKL